MNVIYKYPLKGLDNGDFVEIFMPQGARILAVQIQGIENPTIWAMVNTEEGKLVRRMLRVYGTGREIEERLEDLDYIGTVQTGPFVWHVFERKLKP